MIEKLKETGLLTDRQSQVVRLVALGRETKLVADELGVSQGTVEKTLDLIWRHLGFRGRIKLTHWAILHGLVRLGEPIV